MRGMIEKAQIALHRMLVEIGVVEAVDKGSERNEKCVYRNWKHDILYEKA